MGTLVLTSVDDAQGTVTGVFSVAWENGCRDGHLQGAFDLTLQDGAGGGGR
jgi:hypothetical protein